MDALLPLLRVKPRKEATMKKRFCVAMMVLSVILSTAGMITAASHKNMVGTWSGRVDFVGWNSSVGFYYDWFTFTYEILSEDFATGNFYGYGIGPTPFTGNVATNKRVTIIEYGNAGEYRILNATVSGRKMSGTMQHFKSDQVDTGTFTFYKQ
jgi:hypothetical protein